MDPALRTSLLAGALAGLGALAAFVALHAVVVRFIPWMLVEGAIPAGLAGAAAGSALHHLRPRLPRGWLAGPALGAVLWLPLPVFLPLVMVTGRQALTAPGLAVILGGVAAVVLAVWLAARALLRDAAQAKGYAIGFLPGALLLGGTLLSSTGTGRAWAITLGMLPIEVLAGAVLVALDARLAKRAAS